MILCFKVASEAAKIERAAAQQAHTLAGKVGDFAGEVFSEGIARVTGGRFSHVQMWVDGYLSHAQRFSSFYQSHAQCFSSFEPDGTKFITEDLTVPGLWVLVEIGDLPEEGQWCKNLDMEWCYGRAGRRYNFAGIDGLLLHRPITDTHDDFCSQCCFEFLQDRRGQWPGMASNLIVPGGFEAGNDTYQGLYELCMAAGYKEMA